MNLHLLKQNTFHIIFLSSSFIFFEQFSKHFPDKIGKIRFQANKNGLQKIEEKADFDTRAKDKTFKTKRKLELNS